MSAFELCGESVNYELNVQESFSWIATKTPNTVTIGPLVQRPTWDRSKQYSFTELAKEENYVELGKDTALF